MPRLIDTIGLQTAAGRLLFFGIATGVLLVVPFSWLAHLSLWQHLSIPSPSIGLTRAYWLILHGDPAAAWQLNKLIFGVLAIGIPLLARDAWHVISDRKSHRVPS